MNTKPLLWSVIIGATLFTAGCGPAYRERGYGYGSPYSSSIYDPFFGGGYGGSGGYYDPYYGTRTPYYGSYDPRSHREVHRELEHDAARVEQKYDKGMYRLDRQEQEAQEKATRRFGGNTSDPRYQEALKNIDRKYDHKRDKVENLRNKGYRNLDREHDRYHGGW